MAQERLRRLCPARFLLVVLMLVPGWSGTAAAQAITEYPIPTANNGPQGITTGPDGALWFTEGNGNKIGRITTTGVITEYPVPTAGSGITAGPDGALWFTGAGNIGRITTAGSITEYPLPTSGSFSQGAVAITTGPDGALWFTWNIVDSGGIGRITTTGAITEYGVGNSSVTGITAGPDGALWFTGFVCGIGCDSGFIGRITTAGTITQYGAPGVPNGITTGPDGALWFAFARSRTSTSPNGIGRITTSGVQTEYPIPSGNIPNGITSGPDGALWFTEQAASKIGRITTAGVITEFSTPTSASQPDQIATGPDGRLWFTEQGANQIGAFTQLANYTLSIVPSGTGAGTVTSNQPGINCGATCSAGYYPTTQVTLSAVATTGSTFAGWSGGGCSGTNPCTVTLTANTAVTATFVQDTTTNIALVAAVLPLSRSVEIGATATAFATILNAGPGNASTCTIAPATTIPASFLYQTTDPTTNALTGTANTPANIAAGAGQSFVIAFTPTAAFAPTNVLLTFGCANASPAPQTVGIDTLNLSASATPVPDIVALAASADPGYVDIPGATGTGDFAVATVNLGSSAQITANANTGTANLPVTLLVCQTNSTTGACLATPAANVTTTIAANATTTFGIFAIGSAPVPNSPGVNRVFVTFTDANGVLRGETSVAVRTQ
jgi:virginiamycin B lyase